MSPEERIFRAASAITIIFPLLLISTVAADVGLSLIAVLFLARSHIRKDWGWCREAWVWLLGLLWLYMIARGLFALEPKAALGRALPFGRYIVFAAALARWTLKDEATRRRFLSVLTGAVVFCAFDGLLQYATGRDLLWHPIIHDPNTGHVRLNGPFPKKPILGIMLTFFAFPVLLPLLFSGRRPFALLCLLAVTAAIALSGERMALLLMLMGWGITVLLLRPRWRLVLGGFAGLVVLLGVLAFAVPDFLKRQIVSTEQTLAHFWESPYGLLLEGDLALVAEHPVIGLGADQFQGYCEAHYGNQAKQMCNTHPHNIWLEWLIEEGVIGFALFAGAILFIFRDCICAFLSGLKDPLFAGLLIALCLRLWPFMSTTNFFSRWGAPPFWLVLGALLVYTAGKPEKKSDADPPLTL